MECVDILMATYNGEKFLKEQLDSILNQTYINFRLIISDDCSKDNTKNILEEYKKKDSRISVYYQKSNLGVIKNFEFLLSKVQNNFFMFSDQDDFWKEKKIEYSMNKMIQSNSDLIYTDLEVVDENLNFINESYWKLKKLYKKIHKYNNFKALYLNNFVTGCTILCKSKWIKEFLPIPKNSKYILHDYWIAIVVSKNGKVDYMDYQSIKYRQHDKNSVGSKMVSEEMNSIDEIRELFINVKIDHFTTFLENEKIFSDKEKIENIKNLKYYKKLKKIKYFNFCDLITFFKLYKYENLDYKIKNMLILHFPIVSKFLFKMIKNN